MELGAISGWFVANIIVFALLVLVLAYQAYMYFMGKKSAAVVDNATFKAGMRKAQIVDLREPAEFKRSHILGARNMPFSQFRLYENALRKDMPVYLYDQGKSLSIRTALKLKKAGYTDITILKDGFARWDGKVKSSK